MAKPKEVLFRLTLGNLSLFRVANLELRELWLFREPSLSGYLTGNEALMTGFVRYVTRAKAWL